MKKLMKIFMGFALCLVIAIPLIATGCGKKKTKTSIDENPQTETTSYIGQTVKAEGATRTEDKYVKLVDKTRAVMTFDNMALLGTYTGSDGVYQLMFDYWEGDNLIVRTFNYVFGANDIATVTETTTASGEFTKLSPTSFVKVGDYEIQTGLWVGLAAEWDGEMNIYGVDVGGEASLTYILENGRVFSSDGIYSMQEVEFVVLGDHIVKYSYDSFGNVSHIDLFYYEESYDYVGTDGEPGQFDFPVIYSFDFNEESQGKYFERFLPEDEFELEFLGGTFDIELVEQDISDPYLEDGVEGYYFQDTSGNTYPIVIDENGELILPTGHGIELDLENLIYTRTITNNLINRENLIKRDSLIERSESELDITGSVQLNANKSVIVTVAGKTATGTWYNLNDGLLIVLDEEDTIFGSFFTIFAIEEGVGYERDGEKLLLYGETEIYSEEYYIIEEDLELVEITGEGPVVIIDSQENVYSNSTRLYIYYYEKD